jgi:hypothetical protein
MDDLITVGAYRQTLIYFVADRREGHTLVDGRTDSKVLAIRIEVMELNAAGIRKTTAKTFRRLSCVIYKLFRCIAPIFVVRGLALRHQKYVR